jgi:Beta/Gamma crystallin
MSVPEVVVFQDIAFGGDEWRTNLNYTYVGSSWNDEISSIIVVSGTWQFYSDADYGGSFSRAIGPGYYPFVEDEFVNIPNDSISSFQVVSFEPVDIVDPVTVDVIDEINWPGTGYEGTDTVSKAAYEAYEKQGSDYRNYA